METPWHTQIAATAARLVVEDGMAYGPAKRHALKSLGLPPRTPLPGNDELEDAVREHIDLFCADTQPAELRALRSLALVWMQRLAEFRPYLGGAVWNGTATRLSDIDIGLFCDDPKSAELRLIDQGVSYETGEVSGLRGDPVPCLSLQSRCDALGEHVGVHLRVYDHDHLRGALKPDSSGRKARGDVRAVLEILEKESHV